MRDLLLTIIIFGSIPYIILKPHVGIVMWTWISLMNPHRLTWGFISDFPVALLIGLTTIIAWVISKENKKIPWDPIVVLMTIYLIWTGITTQFALVPDAAVAPFEKFAKSILMILVTLTLMRTEQRFLALIWVIVISIGFFSTKGGIFTLMTGGQFRVWGPPGSVIKGNNELAVATLMVMPLMRYLALRTDDWRIRWGLNASILLSLASVVGSYSRGAFLAMAALALVWWWKSKRRAIFAIVAVILGLAVVPVIPQKWVDRMQSIENYEEDGSAMGRLKIWTLALNVANDRPITGGGFGVFRGHEEVYQKYNPEATRRNVHSIYFEVLGTQGYVGMAIFLALALAAWRGLSWIEKQARGRPELEHERSYASMLKLTLISYAVGGAFLNLSTFDMFYLLLGTIVLCKGIVVHKLNQASAEEVAAQTPWYRRPAAVGLGPAPEPALADFRRAP